MVHISASAYCELGVDGIAICFSLVKYALSTESFR